MPIQYNSDGHIESVSVHSAVEARLVIHELNLKKNEYAATRQRIAEQLALVQPKAKGNLLGKMWGGLGQKPVSASTTAWVRQLEERQDEFDQHITAIDGHIASIHRMIAEHAKAV